MKQDTADRITERLTSSELSKIKKMILGYGNFKKTVIKSGLPLTTLRDIINKGYGYPENIELIRRNLLETERVS